jgi:hypothetical protein
MKPASYPHIHSRDGRYAHPRCAPAVDMTGCGQLLRTCPQPLDNPLAPSVKRTFLIGRKADISILRLHKMQITGPAQKASPRNTAETRPVGRVNRTPRKGGKPRLSGRKFALAPAHR